jgi:hypothetical protein
VSAGLASPVFPSLDFVTTTLAIRTALSTKTRLPRTDLIVELLTKGFELADGAALEISVLEI